MTVRRAVDILEHCSSKGEEYNMAFLSGMEVVLLVLQYRVMMDVDISD